MVAHVADGVVGQVGAEVVAVVFVQPYGPVVLPQLRTPLVGQGAVKAIPAVKATAQRPAVMRACRAVVGHVHQVPLANGIAGIGMRRQHFSNGGGSARNFAPVAGVAPRPFGNDTHADGMRVATGQQARARGRAHRGDVKVVVAQAPGGQRIHARRGDFRAIAADVRKAHIVQHDEQDVRRADGGGGLGRPPGRGIAVGGADLAWKIAFAVFVSAFVDVFFVCHRVTLWLTPCGRRWPARSPST